MASGKHVALHIIVSQYLLPTLAFGRGPMQSVITSLSDSPQAGIDLRGATGIGLFGFLMISSIHGMFYKILPHLISSLARKMRQYFMVCYICTKVTSHWQFVSQAHNFFLREKTIWYTIRHSSVGGAS